MDPKDVKPARPSLLSTSDRNAPSSAIGARILADMETGSGRKPHPARGRRRPRWLLLGVAAMAMLAGYCFHAVPGWNDGDAAAEVVAEIQPPATGAASTAVGALADAGALPEPFDSLSTRADDSAEFPLSAILDEAPGVAADTGAALPAAQPRRSVAKTVTPRKRTQAGDSKRAAIRSAAPLMTSLLETIEQDKVAIPAIPKLPHPQPVAPPAPVPAATVASDRSAMDALVRQIEQGTTVASSAGRRTQTVQAALRKCPRANTRAGLRCREKICARFRGQDRACPD